VQSASADFIAAESGLERRPIYRCRVDWDNNGFGGIGTIDDIDAQVEAFTISREVKTDLPENVTLISGRSSASATITIGAGDASDQARMAAWYYSEDNTASPLFGKARQFRAVKIEVGFVTAAGPEYLTLFTGRTRDVQVDGTAGRVTIECLDASELFRGDRELPSVLADDQVDTGGRKPGLNGSFLIDWGLRRVGYYASPPPRAAAKVSATLHGSAFPEIGDLGNCFSGLRSPFNFTPGPFVEGLIFGGVDTTKVEMTTVTTAGVAWNFRMTNTRIIAWEGWVKVAGGVTDRGIAGVFEVPITTDKGVGLYINGSGLLALYQKTANSGAHNQATTFDIRDGAWHYVAFCATYGTNTVSTKVRVDGSTQTLGTPAGFGNSTTFAMTVCFVGKSYTSGGTLKALLGSLADIQFSEEDIEASGFNNGFTPTATVAPSLSDMLAVPPLDGSLWDAMDTVAQAEFGVLILDETGVPTFYTRTTWEASPFDTVQMTLTTATAVKELVTNNPIDAVRNWIKLGGVIPEIKASTTIWRAASRIRIPANNANDYGYGNGKRVLSCGFEAPVYSLDASFIYGSVVGLNESGYRGARNIDGSGGNVSNLTFTITNVFADHLFLEVSNPSNAFEVWLVNGEGIGGVTPGLPTLLIYGQPASFNAATTPTALHVDKRDATSWAAYGQQLLELTDNPCRQDLDSFEGIADTLLAQLKDPTRILRSLPIIGRLRLQLGDRIRITDVGGTALDGEFRVTKLETSLSRSGGLTQTLDVRTAS
jgi:hypothetical protein